MGFYVACAYIPSISEPAVPAIATLTPIERIVEVAKNEFRSWEASLCKHASKIKLKLFNGDTLAFSHSLQNLGGTGEHGHISLFRDRNHFNLLQLSGPDYSFPMIAPLSFNVNDTSNLIVHLSTLNYILATMPLLKHVNMAALYTVKLVPVLAKRTARCSMVYNVALSQLFRCCWMWCRRIS
jgi:hypothetical protein